MLKKKFLLLLAAVSAHVALFAQSTLDLQGLWQLSVADSLHYSGYAVLPGLVPADTPGASSASQMWYRKSVYVPDSWRKQRVLLLLERPSGATALYVNGREVGDVQPSFAPHEYDVTECIIPGRRNSVTVCVSSGSSGRNGVSGQMQLRMQQMNFHIKKVTLSPYLQYKALRVLVELEGLPRSFFSQAPDAEIVLAPVGGEKQAYHHFSAIEGSNLDITVPLGDGMLLWDEFHPQCYRLGIAIADEFYETTFGVRDFFVTEGQAYINGYPIFLRGTVEPDFKDSADGIPMDEDAWEEIVLQCKSFGLNCMAFSSYCPPDAAFAAADKHGFYLYPNGMEWPDAFSHHPSFMMPDSLSQLSIPVVSDRWPEVSMEEKALRFKQEIESNLRQKDCAGFLLPDMSLCDSTWTEFSSPLVALARLPATTFTSSDTLVVPVDFYNAMYGTVNVRNTYYITDDNQNVLTGGLLYEGEIPIGKNAGIGTVCFPLDEIRQPARLRLNISVGRVLRNHWDFMVTPAPASADSIQ